MTAKRAAAYCGGGLLLLAGFSFAGALGRQTADVAGPAVPVQTSGTANLVAEVQAQTSRLRARLSQAPARSEPVRNPFTFAPRVPAPRPARTVEAPPPASADPALLLPAEPAIELVGVAEDKTDRGIVRTAIVSALSGDLFLVKEGETLAGRYKVKSVSPDAVELTDTLTNGTKRLTLRQ